MYLSKEILLSIYDNNTDLWYTIQGLQQHKSLILSSFPYLGFWIMCSYIWWTLLVCYWYKVFLLPATVAILFSFYFFAPSIAGNQASCQLLNSASPGVILSSNNTMFPEVIGRISDEDKNFTGSVKAGSDILNITESQLNMSLTK